jgi:hypothetical protein
MLRFVAAIASRTELARPRSRRVARTRYPTSSRRLTMCRAMNPEAPVTTIGLSVGRRAWLGSIILPPWVSQPAHVCSYR